MVERENKGTKDRSTRKAPVFSVFVFEAIVLKEENIKKMEEMLQGWSYPQKLPKIFKGFFYRNDMRIEDDTYLLFSYENPALHSIASVYYHEETKEFKLSTQIGLTKFCRIEFIAPTLEIFERRLDDLLEKLLAELCSFDPASVSSIVYDKHILGWEYGKSLPTELEGFERFISSEKPLKITNGSYIILDYSDFSIESGLLIYYNIFRDEFFGEARICGIPEINYLFDSHDLDELEIKLEHHLTQRLRDVRQKAVSQK